MDLQEDRFVIRTPENAYGLSVAVSLDAKTAFGDIRRMQQMMYLLSCWEPVPEGS